MLGRTRDAGIEHAVLAEVLLKGCQTARRPRPAVCEGVAIHDHIVCALRSTTFKRSTPLGGSCRGQAHVLPFRQQRQHPGMPLPAAGSRCHKTVSDGQRRSKEPLQHARIDRAAPSTAAHAWPGTRSACANSVLSSRCLEVHSVSDAGSEMTPLDPASEQQQHTG